MRVTAKAADLEISLARVQRVSHHRRGLCWPLITEHSLVPGLTGEAIGFLARFLRAFRRCPDRTAVDRLSRFGALGEECARAVEVGKPLQLAARRSCRRKKHCGEACAARRVDGEGRRFVSQFTYGSRTTA